MVHMLTDRDRAILAFEETHRRDGGAKDVAILEQFNLSRARYYQVLNGLLDSPDAVAEFPMLVRSLLEVRTQRLRERATRTLD